MEDGIARVERVQTELARTQTELARTQTELLQALRDADEARGKDWIPGRIHCGHPVRIYERCFDAPLITAHKFLRVELEWKDGVAAPHDAYFEWLLRGDDGAMDPATFAPEVWAALTTVRNAQAAPLRGEGIYDPACEELGLFVGRLDGKLTVSEWVAKEVAERAAAACGARCKVFYVSAPERPRPHL